MNVPLVITDFLDRARTTYGSSLAVVCGAERLTYARLGERIDRLSTALVSLGVRKGDVVAYVSFNCHRLLEGYYAVPRIGAILLPLNIRLKPADIGYILNDSQARVVIVDRALLGLLAPLHSQLPDVQGIIAMGEPAAEAAFAMTDYETMIAQAAPDGAWPQLHEDDVAELFYTSGTTARPCGVMLTHRNLYLHALSAGLAIQIQDRDVQLHSIPLFHVNGWGTPHILTLLGGRHIMMPRFDPEAMLRLVDREAVTVMQLVPTMAAALLSCPALPKYNLGSLRRIILGGAASPPSLIAALDARLPNCLVTSGYGLTETSPVVSCASPKSELDDDPARSLEERSSAGLPIPGVAVTIRDDQGRRLEQDGVSSGEICIRSNTVMHGYWKDTQRSSEAFVDGWFRTGDIGTIDDLGYIHIVDRKKDLIISGGENVVSVEIEDAILQYPNVQECAVIAVPDPYWGDAAAAFIVRKPGSDFSEGDLLAHCRATLAGYKVPKHVRFIDELPKGGTGKVLKRELRQKFA